MISFPMRALLCVSLLALLAGCNDGSGDPKAQIGANPVLPDIQQYFLPPMHIARIVGPSGHVLGIDPLPLRIGLAVSRARDNLSFEQGDAYDLARIPDRSFDAIVLNAVLHWLPEKTGPLLAFWRILRPNGRLGISTGPFVTAGTSL